MLRVLFLCTANVCRSPMAEGFLRHRAERDALDVLVGSAGFLEDGARPPPEAVAAMAAFGIDTSGHRSHRCLAADLGAADLVLGMARSHVREAMVLEPTVRDRAFTLKELVRRAMDEPSAPGEPAADWLARLGGDRDRSLMLGSSVVDDVADPIGGTPAMFEATALELFRLVDQLVGLVWANA